jgi:hypothetical protein
LRPSETAHFTEYKKLIPPLVLEERSIHDIRRKEAEMRDQVRELEYKIEKTLETTKTEDVNAAD